MRLPKTPPKRARIEIVPMIDAIFFLLVFFMYSSLSMVKLNGLPVALPQVPGSGTPRPGIAKEAPHLLVALRSDGSRTVRGNPVADTDLLAAVRNYLNEKPETLVVLQAEKGSGIQDLVSVMDALNTLRLADGRTPAILVATEAVTRPDRAVAAPGNPTGPIQGPKP
ncbi:MAG: biopolymer transporter ExbD [Capsulimonadales bacterium]|nr:biopolymer transporter ExbD [Capsulimonadales bacterium]